MKVCLLGLTGCGKSTIAPDIANFFNLNLIEADEEVISNNNGIWPKNEEIIDKYFELTNSKVINKNNILYVISWLDKGWVTKFYENNFTIIELHADLDELIKRKTKRDKIAEKELNRFKKNYKGYFDVILDPLVSNNFSLSIDTTHKNPRKVLKTVIQELKKSSQHRS
ncbi:shikimate kinase [Patescibacteria group bacterium]